MTTKTTAKKAKKAKRPKKQEKPKLSRSEAAKARFEREGGKPARMKGEGITFQYGALTPRGRDLALLREQFWLAHNYRNSMVEIDRSRRTALRALKFKLSPALVAIEEKVGERAVKADEEKAIQAKPATGLLGEIATLKVAIAARNQAIYGGKPLPKSKRTPEYNAGVKQRRADAKAGNKKDADKIGMKGRKADPEKGVDEKKPTGLYAKLAALQEERQKLSVKLYESERWIEASQKIWDDTTSKQRAARWETVDRYVERFAPEDGDTRVIDMGWGVLAQVGAASQSMAEGSAPGFRPWHQRKDKFAVQIQGGATINELTVADWSPHGQAQLKFSRRPGAVAGSKAGERRLQGHLRLRVGSELRENQQGGLKKSNRGVWAEVQFVYHRPIPPQAKIKWIYLIRRERGLRDVWTLHFVLEAPSWNKSDLATTGSVALDLGWKLMEDRRLRVAVWAGSDGHEGEVALPAWWLEEAFRVRRIQAYRDRCKNRAVPEILKWTKRWWDGRPNPHEKDRSINHTSGAQRVIRHIQRGIKAGCKAPKKIMDWVHRERHLHEYQDHLWSQLQGSRKDLYRRLAAYLTKRYAQVVIEDLNLSKFFRPYTGNDPVRVAADRVLRLYNGWAALSYLRDALKNRVRDRELVMVKPEFTTMRCHACQAVDKDWDDHSELCHRCPSCDLEWDQDVNAARNLLRDGGGPQPTWTRPPVSPDEIFSLNRNAPPNRAQRRAEALRAITGATSVFDRQSSEPVAAE